MLGDVHTPVLEAVVCVVLSLFNQLIVAHGRRAAARREADNGQKREDQSMIESALTMNGGEHLLTPLVVTAAPR